MRPDELDGTAIRRIYQRYSARDKGEWGEKCAFQATCQILSVLLEVEPNLSTLTSGDEFAFYRRPDDEFDRWVIRRIAPARNRIFTEESIFLRHLPDIAVFCNDKLTIAVEVKNWDPNHYWRPNEVIDQLLLRFIAIRPTVPCIILTTCNNFPSGSRRIIESFGFQVRLVHNFPLPCFDMELSTQEMRGILEEFITLDRLTEYAWDSSGASTP